jgi:hypothetical protein
MRGTIRFLAPPISEDILDNSPLCAAPVARCCGQLGGEPNFDTLGCTDLLGLGARDVTSAANNAAIVSLKSCFCCAPRPPVASNQISCLIEEPCQHAVSAQALTMCRAYRRSPDPADAASFDSDTWEPLGLLGRGSTASVHAWRNPSTGKVAAVKGFFGASPHGSPPHPALLRGAPLPILSIPATLSHPNIAAPRAVSLRGEVVMEAVAGISLAELVRGAPLPEPQVSRLIAGVTRGLAYLHAQEIIHGDVKVSACLAKSRRVAARHKECLPCACLRAANRPPPHASTPILRPAR